MHFLDRPSSYCYAGEIVDPLHKFPPWGSFLAFMCFISTGVFDGYYLRAFGNLPRQVIFYFVRAGRRRFILLSSRRFYTLILQILLRNTYVSITPTV